MVAKLAIRVKPSSGVVEIDMILFVEASVFCAPEIV
jgi:hypothetical protein